MKTSGDGHAGRRPRRHEPTTDARGVPLGWYDVRVCVPAPPPVTCPHCGGSETRIGNGVHYNLRTRTRIENRVCAACRFTFTAARPMTREELARRGAL